jgi:hypothetical protein
MLFRSPLAAPQPPQKNSQRHPTTRRTRRRVMAFVMYEAGDVFVGCAGFGQEL